MTASRTSTRNKRRKRRFYKRKRFWLGLLLLAVILGAFGYVAGERYTRPYRERAATYDLEKINELEIPSLILGRDGGEIGRFFIQNRSVIGIDRVPERFIDALRAGEDKRFYEHDGVDYIGVVRAAKSWISAGEAVSGASTITQQLARGAFSLEADRRERGESALDRKLVEAFLAMRIEKRYRKEQILEFYLNRIYFGSGFYGLRSASLGYFGKEPEELDDIECATLVGVIKNPTGLSPLNNRVACQGARNMVIARMAKLGMFTGADARRMVTAPVRLDPKPLRRGTSHLYERIADEIRSLLGEEGLAAGGLEIRTSIDSRVQNVAEARLEETLERAEARPGYAHPRHGEFSRDDPEVKQYLQGAVLMIDHRNGGVIAHVGGRDYAEVPFDVIELGRRPLGTAFHPILYAAALESGMTPASTVEDEPMDNRAVMVGGREGILGEWGMETTSPRYEGAVTLRRALESSKIAASVRVANRVGLGRVVEQARAFGLRMPEDVELLPRLALGWEPASLREAVSAYAAFARGGRPGPGRLWYVESVRDAHGHLRFQRPATHANTGPAVSDATAFQVHSMLRGGMERGSAEGLTALLDITPFNGAGKPGTTHDFSDNWFLGYNGRVSCGVWVGFLESGRTIYEGAFARDLAMPVWAAVMNSAGEDFGGRGIPQPATIVDAEICRVSGERATPYCYEMVEDPASGRMRSRPSAIREYFRQGTENLPFCSLHTGAAPHEPGQGAIDITALAVIDTSPVQPKQPTLIGDDPYHSIHVNSENTPKTRVRVGRTNVLDSFDLEDAFGEVELPKPERLEILPD